MIFEAMENYPETGNIKKDINFARILQNDYSGKISEFASISTYFYQSAWLKNKNPEISKIISNIAKVEMKHLDLIGETIVRLGGDPRFWHYYKKENYNNYNTSYWNGSYISYEKILEKMILENVNNELASITNYNNHINLTGDITIKNIIRRIIMDEKVHIALFESIYKNLL